MSDTEVLSGKAKKAKRSEERFKKNKKRKRDDEAAEDAAETIVGAEEKVTDGSKSEDRNEANTAADTKPKAKKASNSKSNKPNEPEDKAQSQKKRKREDITAEATNGDSTEAAEPSKHRYIVFIGNLPYSATDESIQEHFKAITPSSIRHRTDPKTKKSKGFAFLEFASFDRMKTCLKLYHHSEFTSGKPGEKKRRINVELTAGGGGKGEQRKKKLGEKNTRLEDQRKRRAEALAKQENRKEKKGKGKQGGEGPAKDGSSKEAEGEGADASEGMHPARLAMMRKNR